MSPNIFDVYFGNNFNFSAKSFFKNFKYIMSHPKLAFKTSFTFVDQRFVNHFAFSNFWISEITYVSETFDPAT
jgi:hypothetical protein